MGFCQINANRILARLLGEILCLLFSRRYKYVKIYIASKNTLMANMKVFEN